MAERLSNSLDKRGPEGDGLTGTVWVALKGSERSPKSPICPDRPDESAAVAGVLRVFAVSVRRGKECSFAQGACFRTPSRLHVECRCQVLE